jgi:uncharacterized membrane protein
MHLPLTLPTIFASFLASLVEFVEALTIVLAIGIVRGWRWTLAGAVSALAGLVALVLVLGPSLVLVPLPVLQVVIGTLLLMFGLRWLRKAILRAAGIVALHDEQRAFEKETAAMQGAETSPRGPLDAVAFAAAFKGVFLEGLEVVFIVIAMATRSDLLTPAATGAALAFVTVLLLGVVLHRPLTRVPENALKLCVGILLAAFGTFWVGEGSGLEWRGGDGSLIALALLFGALAAALVFLARRLGARRKPSAVDGASKTSVPEPTSSAIVAAWRELYGLFVDDILLAAGIFGAVAIMVGQAHLALISSNDAATLLLVTIVTTLLAISSLKAAARS